MLLSVALLFLEDAAAVPEEEEDGVGDATAPFGVLQLPLWWSGDLFRKQALDIVFWATFQVQNE